MLCNVELGAAQVRESSDTVCRTINYIRGINARIALPGPIRPEPKGPPVGKP